MNPAPRPAHALCLTLALLGLAACSREHAPYASLELAAKGAHSAAIASDGKQAAIGSLTHGGSLWNIETGERRFNWNHRAGNLTPITAIGFSPEGAYALSAEGSEMVLWSTASGEALTFFTAPAAVQAVALGPQGDHALLGLADDKAVIFDARRGGVLREFAHQGRVHSVAMDARGTLALSGSADGTAQLWKVADGTALQVWTHEADVRLVALAADGSRALSVSKYDRAVVWDTATGLELAELATLSTRIVRGETFTAAAFSADGSRLLTGASDSRVLLWQISPLELRARWSLPRRSDWKRSGAYLLAVGFAPGDRDYLAIGADGFIHRLAEGPR